MRKTSKYLRKEMSKRGLKFLVFVQCLLFLSPTNLFKYFKRRYNNDQIAFLNTTLKLRGKLNNVLLNLSCLRKCSLYGVALKRIQAWVRKSKAYHSLKIEKAFIKDEVDRCQQSLALLRKKFLLQFRGTRKFLSECDYLRFARLISQWDVKQRDRVNERNESDQAAEGKVWLTLCLRLNDHQLIGRPTHIFAEGHPIPWTSFWRTSQHSKRRGIVQVRSILSEIDKVQALLAKCCCSVQSGSSGTSSRICQ